MNDSADERSISHLPRLMPVSARDPASEVSDPVRVAALLFRDMVRLPSWFNAAQAAAILRQRDKRFALLTDRAGVSRIATVAALSSVGATKSAEACAVPLGLAVDLESTLAEALELMNRRGVDMLPVRGGGPVGAITGLLAGIVLRQDIVAHLNIASPPVTVEDRLAVAA